MYIDKRCRPKAAETGGGPEEVSADLRIYIYIYIYVYTKTQKQKEKKKNK